MAKILYKIKFDIKSKQTLKKSYPSSASPKFTKIIVFDDKFLIDVPKQTMIRDTPKLDKIKD